VHGLVGQAHAVDEAAPFGEIGLALFEMEHATHVIVETLVVEDERIS